MAEMFNPLNPEILELGRQRRMADLLTSQGMQTPQGQTVAGGIYVPPNPMEYIAKLYSTYQGAQANKNLDAKEVALAKALREGKQQETQEILSTLAGTPEKVTQMAGPYSGNVPMPTATMPARSPDIQGAMNLAMQSQFGAGKELLPTLIQRALPEPVKPTTDMQNYEYARSQGFKGSLNDFKNQITPYQQAQLAIDREKFEFDKSQKGAGKDLTESQGKASAFQSQMVSASNAVNTLESQGFNPTLFRSQTAVKLAGGVANPAVPVAAQQYKQAQDQWSEAYLRFKTGAAATEPEVVRNNRTFFPVFGDKPEQIAQKAAAREQAERDIGIAAGRGANLGAQAIGQQPRQFAAPKPTGLPSQSAIDAELKRRGL
jgi:hypothetical protein